MIVLIYINFIFEIFMFIDVTLKSKNKNSILEFLNIFKHFSKNKKLQLSRTLTFLQNKEYKKVFSVLKSPHVNKTAQEQYEFRLFSKKLKINSFQIIKLLIVLKKVQTTLFSDIQLNVKFTINNNKKARILINRFNPDINNNNKSNFEQIKLHLLLLNYYGKYKFIIKSK